MARESQTGKSEHQAKYFWIFVVNNGKLPAVKRGTDKTRSKCWDQSSGNNMNDNGQLGSVSTEACLQRTLPLDSCGTLGEWFTHTAPHFPHLWNRDNNDSYFTGLLQRFN